MMPLASQQTNPSFFLLHLPFRLSQEPTARERVDMKTVYVSYLLILYMYIIYCEFVYYVLWLDTDICCTHSHTWILCTHIIYCMLLSVYYVL